MFPQEIFTDHIRPFLDPEAIFWFVKIWEDDRDMLVVLRWLFDHDLLDPYQAFQDNWNLLSWACYHNHQGVVNVLLETKTDLRRLLVPVSIHEFRMGPLDVACYYNCVEVLRQLAVYDPSLFTPSNLRFACERNNEEVCYFLVEHGVPARDPLLFLPICRCHNNTRLYHLLKENGCPLTHRYMFAGRTLLMYACIYGCLEIVKDLITSSCCLEEKDVHGNTALVYACQPHGKKTDLATRVEIVRLLVAHGARINQQNEIGRTALFYAIQHGFYPIASHLFENGADAHIQDNSRTNVLMVACHYKRHDILNLILKHYDARSINTRDDMGRTALTWACSCSPPDAYIVRKLVKAGAEIGPTALYRAYENGADDNTIAMLLP